jgi:hypothetical protein
VHRPLPATLQARAYPSDRDDMGCSSVIAFAGNRRPKTAEHAPANVPRLNKIYAAGPCATMPAAAGAHVPIAATTAE